MPLIVKQRATVEMIKEALDARELAWTLGGVGGAALENQHILPDLDEKLKKVNLGIGGTTGYLMANPQYRAAALASLPFKELGLFGVSSADKLRQQQQSLVDANLGVAQTNQQTALLNRGNASSSGARALAFLIPAILAGGGIGYMGYNQWKKNRSKSQNPRWQTTGSSGTQRGGKKVRVDIPASALPDEFYESLMHGEESPKAYTRIMSKQAPEESKEARAVLQKLAATDEGISIPRTLGSMAWDMTGIPGTMQTAKELGRAGGNYSAGNFGDAARYGVAGLGAGLLALGAGFLGNRLGKSFLAGQMGRMAGSGQPAGQFRNLVKPLMKWGPEEAATMAARKARYAYDPARYAWSGSTSRNPIFQGLFTDRPVAGYRSLPRQAYDVARYGGNRALNTAYRGKQWFMRHPVMGPTLAGLPLAGVGSQRDEAELEAARNQYQATPQWDQNRGPYNIPVSTVLSTLMGAFGSPDPRTRMQGQLQGAPWDPWAYSR